MKGNIRKRGAGYEITFDVGTQPCRRCVSCNRRYWVQMGSSPEQCKCGSALADIAGGERRQMTKGGFRRKKDAESALRERLGAVEDGTHVAATRITVEDYLAQWVAGLRVKPSTLSNYEVCINVHLVPRVTRDGRPRPGIGHLQLQHLQPEHLDALYRWLEREGKRNGGPMAPKSVRHVHTCIRKALQDAVDRRRLVRNVADLANPPSQKQARSFKARDRVWTTAHLRTFLQGVDEDRLHACWLLVATTGMRRGEVAGLRWIDLDEDRRLHIRHTRTQVAGRTIAQDSTKTEAGARVIALDEATVGALRSHRVRQLEERMAWGAGWTDSGYVFVDEAGEPFKPDWILRRFQKLAAALDLPPIDFHGLRHSYATAARRAGVDIEVLSHRLGHSDVAITLNTYRHVSPDDDLAAADQAAGAILGT